MRIIKNPNPVKEQEKECDNCGCVFAFTEGDVKYYCYSNNVLGPGVCGYREKYILCPNCGEKIILEKTQKEEPIKVDINFEELVKKLGLESETGDTNEPDIDDLSMFPHLIESDEENGRDD